MQVQELMTKQVKFVRMDTLMSDIWALFRDNSFHHLPVLDEHDALVGIISDRDVLYNISPRVESGNSTVAELEVLRKPAHQFMSRRPMTVYPTSSAGHALRMIIDQGVSCLPVVNDDQYIVGILTWRDFMPIALKRIEEAND